ncbi:MAG: cysteine-rich CWC family protein [Tissierellia bacterium]|nr:cysteine-rich CWC family protein [Tissierellia bacterium]
MAGKSNFTYGQESLPADKICPICGQYNGCKRSRDCWCHNVKISGKVLAMVPEDKRGIACICKDCIEKYS